MPGHHSYVNNIEQAHAVLDAARAGLALSGAPLTSPVGFARDPQAFIQDGQNVRIAIDGLGEISNTTHLVSPRSAAARNAPAKVAR